MSHATALRGYLEPSKTESQNQTPGTGGIGQDARPEKNSPGGPSTNSANFQITSNLQSLEKKSVEILDAPKKVPGSLVAYSPVYAEQMYEFFSKKEKNKIVTETLFWKNGEVREVQRVIPAPPPHFSQFAREIGTTERTLKKWAKEYPEFRESYEACRSIIKEFLIDNGLLGHYNGQFAQFVAKNETNMKDKSIHENHNVDLNKLLDKAERSNSPFELNNDDEF